MNLEPVLPWLPLLNILILPIAGWVLKQLRSDLATKHEVAEIQREMSALDRRVALVEQEVRHLPDADDFAGLRGELSDLSGSVRAIDAQIKPFAASLTRIEDHLMRAAKP